MSKDRSTPNPTFSRRGFMQRIGALGAAGGGIGLLAHCGGEAQQSQTAVGGCNDVSGLSEQARNMREGLAYVDSAPSPDKVCTNCAFWEEAPAGQLCGGCQLIEGPIHPDGYCNSWAPIPEEPAG
jgi:hypothetical protein